MLLEISSSSSSGFSATESRSMDEVMSMEDEADSERRFFFFFLAGGAATSATVSALVTVTVGTTKAIACCFLSILSFFAFFSRVGTSKVSSAFWVSLWTFWASDGPAPLFCGLWAVFACEGLGASLAGDSSFDRAGASSDAGSDRAALTMSSWTVRAVSALS